MEDTQKTFASPSKEVAEKEKRQNKQTKKKTLAIAKTFTLHENGKIKSTLKNLIKELFLKIYSRNSGLYH